MICIMGNIDTSTKALSLLKYKLGMESFCYFGDFKNAPITFPIFISLGKLEI